ncbi:hypothetical protein K1719_013675 [Acacia pycnantha]|nr:hypothetical protein K1719_013675 [Acacia pycnantha]
MAGEGSGDDVDAGSRSSFAGLNEDKGVDVAEEQEQEVEDVPEEEDGEDMDAGDEEYIEDDGEFTFRFEDGVNPLDFVENNDSGIQSYQQLERLENEALADKKRKAVEYLHRDGPSFKKVREEDISAASMEEIMGVLNFGVRRKSRKMQPKKRGRRKGSKKKLDPHLTRMLGDATLHYAHERYEEAISILHEVIRLAPNLPDSYHTLGLVYSSLKDYKKAMNFYMIAALLTPKDSSLWKMLFTWSIEQGDIGQAGYCLSKAITADPKDVTLRVHRASLYVELKDYQRAAETYLQVYQLFPEKVGALTIAAKLYQTCGQVESSIHILEDYLKGQLAEANDSVVDLLASIYMETKAYDRALQHIEHAQAVRYSGKEFPLNLKIKAGICHIHLGNMQRTQVLFSDLKPENATEHSELVTDIANSLMALEHYNYALSYYLMLEEKSGGENGLLHLKIARCFLSLKERLRAIEFFYKALKTLEDDVDARITLTSLLLEEGKVDEAILLLVPPKDSDSGEECSDKSNRWWDNEKAKLKLCKIYLGQGMLENFVDTIFPLIRKSLYVGNLQHTGKKRLSKKDLVERVKVLDDQDTDNVFRGFRPIALPSDLVKASRAKKKLQEKAILKEKRKAEALAAGIDWISDGSDDEPGYVSQKSRKRPLCNFLKDEEHHQLIIDLCKALGTLQRYWEALEIINLSLRLAHNVLSAEKKEELRSLGAQMAYYTTDPKHGFDCVKNIVLQHPYSFAAWNCYHKVTSRLENRDSKHSKFVRYMQGKHVDSVPPIVISGHQLTLFSHHQDAARKYLEAYKLLPENPLINLCVGTALINLALGFRLQNKHQCILQGLAFLYNNLKISENSQESLYNIARAYHHVGMVTLAALYYEKVLAIREKDHPIPKLPDGNLNATENHQPGYCDLRREAAYNLHLIYKKSGALDLARQVLKDHCSF